jgi:hypothetical protein
MTNKETPIMPPTPGTPSDLRRRRRINWSGPGIYTAIFAGLLSLHALASIPDQLFLKRTRQQIETVLEVTKPIRTQKEWTQISPQAESVMNWLRERAPVDGKAFQIYVHSPIVATAPGLQPLVNGLEQEYLGRMETLAAEILAGRAAFPARDWFARVSAKVQPDSEAWLVTRVGTALATRRASLNDWAGAAHITSVTATIQHALNEGRGWDFPALAQRGMILQTIASWHFHDPGPADAAQVANLLSSLAASDPTMDLPAMIAHIADMIEGERVQGEDSIRTVIGASWTGPARTVSNARFTSTLPDGRPYAGMTLMLDRGQILASGSGGWFGPLLALSATDAEFQRVVRTRTARHFGQTWSEIPQLQGADPTALLRMGFIYPMDAGLQNISAAVDQRRLVLASYAVLEWSGDESRKTGKSWWTVMERHGAAGDNWRIAESTGFENPLVFASARVPRSSFVSITDWSFQPWLQAQVNPGSSTYFGTYSDADQYQVAAPGWDGGKGSGTSAIPKEESAQKIHLVMKLAGPINPVAQDQWIKVLQSNGHDAQPIYNGLMQLVGGTRGGMLVAKYYFQTMLQQSHLKSEHPNIDREAGARAREWFTAGWPGTEPSRISEATAAWEQLHKRLSVEEGAQQSEMQIIVRPIPSDRARPGATIGAVQGNSLMPHQFLLLGLESVGFHLPEGVTLQDIKP